MVLIVVEQYCWSGPEPQRPVPDHSIDSTREIFDAAVLVVTVMTVLG